MTLFFITLIIFSLAIFIMAIGLFLSNKSLKRGCGLNPALPEKECDVCGAKPGEDCREGENA